jgi:tetratricopeptide (TPR) repeat protein
MKGKLLEMVPEVFLPTGQDFKDQKPILEKRLTYLDSAWKAGKDVSDYSDYGVVLVKLGRLHEALRVFQEIEAKSPGLYSTAANMGTTYELLGQNELALQWIRKSVTINSDSHERSEWLHVKILEIKTGRRKLDTRSILNTDFGDKLIPRSNLASEDLGKLGLQIAWQLNERMSFVKPKDDIVALLLYELGNIYAITEDATIAYRVYQKADEYGYDSPLFRQRFAYVAELQKKLGPSEKKSAGSADVKTTHRDMDSTAIKAGSKQDIATATEKRRKSYYISGGVIVALAAGFAIMRRRRRQA